MRYAAASQAKRSHAGNAAEAVVNAQHRRIRHAPRYVTCAHCGTTFRTTRGLNGKSLCSIACRLWSKVEKTAECWMWTGNKIPKGYGILGNERGDGKKVYAHRLAWALANGPIPDGLWVLHRCDVPSCVRPDHLFLGTCVDNHADMVAKNRHTNGNDSGTSKLSLSDVRQIRLMAAAGLLPSHIARGYPVTTHAIRAVIHNRKLIGLAPIVEEDEQ